MVACGDVDGDGRPDIVASNNISLGGIGTFRCYRNLGSTFTTTPWWESAIYHSGHSDTVGLLDFDRDGDLDLVAGRWWTPTSVFRNSGTGFPLVPTWETTQTTVADDIYFGDVDGDGLRVKIGERKRIDGVRKLFGFDHGTVESLQRVVADGVVLSPADYAFHRERAELTLAQAPQNSLVLDYTWSEAVDLGVPSWEWNKGNYVYSRAGGLDLTLSNGPSAPQPAGTAARSAPNML